MLATAILHMYSSAQAYLISSNIALRRAAHGEVARLAEKDSVVDLAWGLGPSIPQRRVAVRRKVVAYADGSHVFRRTFTTDWIINAEIHSSLIPWRSWNTYP